MPAPPSMPPVVDRGHDDIDRVMEQERFDRDRATLLARLQDAEAARDAAEHEAKQLRTPTAVFPPLSTPPMSPRIATPTPSLVEIKNAADIKGLEKAILGSRLGRGAITVGIALALALNAFNFVRQRVPEQKVDAVNERLRQTEKITDAEVEARALERDRNNQRWKAVFCWGKQMRGASQRQGLDLPSLPPGGVTAFKVGDEDPNRPGPPRFIAVEKCPDFPPLPPDLAPQ